VTEHVFLFTDIQRSTWLWSEHTEAMAIALAEHNRMIEKLVGESGGELISSAGDGVLVRYDDPGTAVEVAVEMQRWLDEHRWKAVGRLRVRMGIHIGIPVELSTGELGGPVVNEAARLHDAGHGGQVLLSDRMATALAGRLPPGCSLMNLGEHSLPDIPPSPVHQLCHPDLPSDFPPLRSRTGSSGDLVGRSASFHGRQSELRHLDALVDPSLLSLVGPGGVGKTRLAQVHVARRAASYADGVHIVDLGSIERDGEVPAAVATALQIEHSPNGSGDVTARIVTWLQTRRILLLLDNCEHVASGVRDVVERVTTASGEAHFVCTSHQALELPGEVVYRVPPLDVSGYDDDPLLSSAVELFVDRAREARPAFRPAEGELVAIARLCRELDGLPLAIEVSAAQLAFVDLRTVIDRVLRSPMTPVLDQRGRPQRHRSLHDLVKWSFDLLTPEEQLLFGRLSIFAGPFTAQAAAQVCGRDGSLAGADFDGVLASLVAKSVVVQLNDEATLRLLAPMRSFAAETVIDAERTILRSRFIAWYTAWVAEVERDLQSDRQASAVAALDAEFDNLRAAHRMAIEEGDVANAAKMVASIVLFAVHRFRFEVAAWAEVSLAEATTPDRFRPVLHGLCGMRAWMRGDLESAAWHAEHAIEIETRLEFPPTILARLVRLAVAGYEERFSDAAEEFRVAYKQARVLDDPFWQVELLIFSAVGMVTQGAVELAASIAERAAKLAQQSGNPTSLAWTHYALAESVHYDDPDLAIDFLRTATDLARSVSNEWILGLVQVSLARQWRRASCFVEAAVALMEDLDRWSRAGNWSEQWRTVREAARLCGDARLCAEAAVLLGAVDGVKSVIPISPSEAIEVMSLATSLQSELGADRARMLRQRGRLLASVSPDALVDQARAALRRLIV